MPAIAGLSIVMFFVWFYDTTLMDLNFGQKCCDLLHLGVRHQCRMCSHPCDSLQCYGTAFWTLDTFKTFNGEFSSSTKHHTEHSDGGEHSACVIPARCYWNQLTRTSMRSLFWSSSLTTLTFKWTNTQVFVGIFWFKAGVGQTLTMIQTQSDSKLGYAHLDTLQL